MIRLVMNADDFGLCASVNQAVVQAHVHGVLTSASLMANGAAFAEAVTLAKAAPTLGVGVHLNCLRGRPVSAPAAVASLLNRDGTFVERAAVFAWRWLRGAISLREVEAEWQAQIDRVCAQGIAPTHLDSEKHLHLIFPPLFDLVVRLAVANRIPVVRTICEPAIVGHRGVGRQEGKRWLLARQSRRLRPQALAAGLQSPRHFYGVAATGRMTPAYITAALREMVAGVHEMMFHPALPGGQAPDGGAIAGPGRWLGRQREVEYRLLCDPAVRAACDEWGIQRIHYGSF